MMIRFDAKVVSCTKALGGDILQVIFDSEELDDEDNRQSPYVLLGRCYEFPGQPTVEWFDGSAYDGGEQIRSIQLKRDSVAITVDMTVGFCINLSVTDAKYKKLAAFLKMIYPDSEVAL